MTPANQRFLDEPRPVDLRHVEQEFVKLRLEAAAASETEGADDQPITRACMSNLIVYCDTPQDATALPAQFSMIARRHPARIILLVGEDVDQSAEVSARISASLTNFGSQGQVNSEQVLITASPAGRRRLASAARPLLIGDLPIALWWNSNTPPPSGGRLFCELEEMADTIVYDSRGWRNPLDGLIATANWALDSRNLITDLAWMRSRFWRRLFGETLAPHVLPGALHHIERIELHHGPHALPMVWLFVGWLAHCLSWKPLGGKVNSNKHLEMRFRSPTGPVRVEIQREDSGPAEFRRATVISRGSTAAAGPNSEKLIADFEALDSERLAIHVDAGGVTTENFISTPNDPPVVMLAWQLANRMGQSEFRQALEIARSIAQKLSH